MSVYFSLVANTTNPDATSQNGYGDLADDDYRDTRAYAVLNAGAATVSNERQIVLEGVPMAWWSRRLPGQYTITGAFEVSIAAQQTVADADLRIRVRVSKITAGGSAIETPILTADAAESMTVGSETTHLFSGEIPTDVVMAKNERLIVRVYVFPVTGGFGAGSPVATLNENGSYVMIDALTTGLVFYPNTTDLSLLSTTVSGIGTLLDISDGVRGGTKTASVATTAGGTELPWTRMVQAGTIAVTEITSAVIASTANAATYASASFTPVANRLYLLAVVHSDAAPEATVPTVTTTTGLNFVQVGSSLAFNTIVSNQLRLTLFRAMKPSGLSAGTYTVTLADAGTGCAALLAEVTGMDTTGTDGANAVRNIVTGAINAGANPQINTILWDQPYNGVFACFGSSLATAPTAGTSYTALSNPDYATPTAGLFAEWRADSALNASCTLAASDWAGIAVELVAATSLLNLEWISPRFTNGWIASAASQFSGTIYLHESNVLANAGARIKLYHRLPNGTETLIYTWTSTTELGTTVAAFDLAGGTLNNAISFHEDDRLILRLYLTNVGTMAVGYTGIVTYDTVSEGASGHSALKLFASFNLKPESQVQTRITDGQSMSGIGN